MRLYLARHGDANSGHLDPERRLSDLGRRDVGRVAALLSPLGLELRAVWHSPKPRAAETAKILAGAFQVTEGVSLQDGLKPNDSVQEMAERIRNYSGDLMLVGHLPFMDDMASLLAAGSPRLDVVGFRTATVACIEGRGGTWRLRWVVSPELLA